MSVLVEFGYKQLAGDLTIPRSAKSLILFAHGSGSSRFSPRNKYVAKVLQDAGLATLLFDLLSTTEEQEDMLTRKLRFNIPMLAERMIGATNWVKKQPALSNLNIGYFGASTGAAAALIAAAELPDTVGAVVSRGGRPDLAGAELEKVKAPTLCIVGGLDDTVIDLNRQALSLMQCEKSLVIIPGATHLFEEPGTLEEAASLAGDWFVKHLI